MLVKVPDSCTDLMRGRHRLANASLRPLGQPGAGGSQEQQPRADSSSQDTQNSHHQFKKLSIFCEVFAEGSLPERHTLV